MKSRMPQRVAKSRSVIGLVPIIVLTLALACAPQAAGPPAAPTGAPTAASVKQGQGWESEWQQVIRDAQKEGTLVIYTALKPEAREALTTAMKEKYGIKVETVFGRGGDLPPKIRAERGAGLYLADIGLFGIPMLIDMKELKLTPPLEPMLLLPEVKDQSKWVMGKFPWMDANKETAAPVLSGMPAYIRNTEQVGENDIAATTDLLKPVWKQKIIMYDPSATGLGNEWYTHIHAEVLGMDGGKKFMEDLAKQEPVVVRDDRVVVESVARGKYLIGIGASPSTVGEFIKMGATVNYADVKAEPRGVSAGAAILNAFTPAPHPNAQKLFVNWLLSKEGVSILSQAAQFAPARVDVPGEGVLPIMFPRKGDVLVNMDKELLKVKMREPAAQLFGSLMK